MSSSIRAETKPLHACPWRKIRHLDPEDVVEYRDRILASKFYKNMPLSANAMRWRALFEKKKLTEPKQLSVYIEEFMKERGWPPVLRSMVLMLKPGQAVDILEDRHGVVLDILDRAARRNNPDEIAMMAAHVVDANRPVRVDTRIAIVGAAKLYHLPVATTRHDPLNKGTGASSNVYRGELPDKTPVALKIQKAEVDDSETFADDQRLRGLADLGAPKSYGLVRVRDELGRWRPAVAIELVPGKDLLTLDKARSTGQPAPLLVTEKHIQAMEKLVQTVESNGWVLGDIMPGDFMLTPDGRVVPLDMSLEKTGSGPGWTSNQASTRAILREEILERLYKVYEAQHGRPAPRKLPPRAHP